MRLLSLAIFAVIALAIGLYERDGMTIGLGVASGLAAAASAPALRVSTFLDMMSEFFAAETVLFGLADLVNALGLWPEAYKDFSLPRYLPIATAVFVITITLVSLMPLVKKMMGIADPFFDART